MEKNFTEQDSLKLINEMINQARNSYQKGAGSYTIFWGYFIAGICFLHFILSHIFANYGIDPAYAGNIWWIPFPAAVIYYFYARSKAKNKIVTTHINKLISSIWIAFAISCLVFIAVLLLTVSYFDTRYMGMVNVPVILLLLGMGQFISAVGLKVKSFFYAAGIFWLGSILCIILSIFTGTAQIHVIVMGVCMLLGFCVPGHILNKKAKENV